MTDAEVEKYTWVLTHWPSYGAVNHGRLVYDVVAKLDPADVVDVGCGSNAFAREMRVCGVSVTGVDLVHPMADFRAPAHDLPVSADLLTSFDVLEHIPPDLLDETLAEWVCKTLRFVVSIAHAPCTYKNESRSEELHMNVQPREWWIDKLFEYARDVRVIPTPRNRATYLQGEWS